MQNNRRNNRATNAEGGPRSSGRPPRRDSQSGRTRSASSNASRPAFWQKLMDVLPENVWVNRAIALVILLVLIFILFNLVTCIGGAIFPPAGGTQAQSSAASSASSQETSAAAAETATSSAGVDSPWIDGGKFSTGDDALDGYIKALCDEHTSQGATFDQAAYDTYLIIMRSESAERANNKDPWGPTWDVEYAKQYFEEGNTGNQYNFAAVTEYMLKYFGYSDAEAEPCLVKLESGAWEDEGLVFVTNKVDGSRCVIDGTLNADGWMLPANRYEFDVHNIGQTTAVVGTINALNDDNTPTRISQSSVTERLANESAADNGESATTDGENATDGTGATENTDEAGSEYVEEPEYVEGEGETYTEEEYVEPANQTEGNAGGEGQA